MASTELVMPPHRSPAACSARPSKFLPPGLSTFRRQSIATPTRRRHQSLVTAAAREDAAADDDVEASKLRLERRELLLAGSAAAVQVGAAKATPVGEPELKQCGPADVSDPFTPTKKVLTLACCAPQPKNGTIGFQAETGTGRPLRERRAAHLLDASDIEKYRAAYDAMRRLPADDPRSLKQQANVHCAYCNYGYRQKGDPKAQLQIHFNWLFFPWHRLYLYFHEKILGSLIGDSSFALPFWNWDNQEGGSVMPPCFWGVGSPLYDCNRNQHMTRCTVVNLAGYPQSTEWSAKEKDPEEIKKGNIGTMNQNIANQKTADLFMGRQVRYGESTSLVNGKDGSMERAPHTAVHVQVGTQESDDTDWVYGEDMGNFYSAGKDPVFYAHHSNIDRIWNVWRDRIQDSDDPGFLKDPDFLDAQFYFFNENKELVRCKVSDCLDAEKNLGYKYQDMTESDNKWINYVRPIGNPGGGKGNVGGSATLVGQSDTAMAAVYPKLANVELQRKPQVGSVFRPKQAAAKDEVLVLEGVELPVTSKGGLDVFINFPEADKNTPVYIAEYVGSINNVPHFMPGMTGETSTRVADSRFSIRENVRLLGITDASELIVTLVPKGNDPIKIKSAKIEYSN